MCAWKGTRIHDDAFQWLNPMSGQTRPTRKQDSLSLVTGGANGRGEQMASFTNEETYTPNASTMRSLQTNDQVMKQRENLGTYP